VHTPFSRDPGGTVPLFDRLVDAEPAKSAEAYPYAVLDPSGVIASVRREIGRLLDTRRPVGVNAPPLGDRASVRDYGIPDFADLSPLDRDGQAAMESAIRQAIMAFEPRLTNVAVRLVVRSLDSDRRLDAVVTGDIRVGRVEQRVSFPIPLGTGGDPAA
jgi:type VI secretion system lysozyme-like protein